VPDCLDRVAVPGVPARRGLVQRGQVGRAGSPQLQLQEVGEELVVAEPGPPCVQRDDERARLLEPLQDPLTAGPAGQQVGQLAVDPGQDGGPEQQLPRLFRLSAALGILAAS
jgi:hypothetical protein